MPNKAVYTGKGDRRTRRAAKLRESGLTWVQIAEQQGWANSREARDACIRLKGHEWAWRTQIPFLGRRLESRVARIEEVWDRGYRTSAEIAGETGLSPGEVRRILMGRPEFVDGGTYGRGETVGWTASGVRISVHHDSTERESAAARKLMESMIALADRRRAEREAA